MSKEQVLPRAATPTVDQPKVDSLRNAMQEALRAAREAEEALSRDPDCYDVIIAVNLDLAANCLNSVVLRAFRLQSGRE